MKWIPDRYKNRDGTTGGVNPCCVVREDGKYCISRAPQKDFPGVPSYPAVYTLVRLGSPSWAVCYRTALDESERAGTVAHLTAMCHDNA